MAKGMFPFSLISPLLPVNYNNLKKIAFVDKPKLIIHGDDDELVPFAMAQKLFDAAKGPKFFYPIKGAGHNDTYEIGGDDYFKIITSFAQDSKM
jgi:fermentation-respiration switch protein FrsA (DUF1100 family)